MRIVAFYLTIILSFSVLSAVENSNDESKSTEALEYYWILNPRDTLEYCQKLNLAKAYEYGTVLKKDERKAFLYYSKAATNWNYAANWSYTEPEALEYLEKKAKEGNPYAEFSYGAYYDDCELRSYDPEKAFYWYSKAAEKNIPIALNNVAHMYIFGPGVKRDVKKGIELMLKAAELGFESSQQSLAELYAGRGDIIDPNYKDAFKWFEILAKKGSLRAKYDMGVCYFYGRGVPEDKSKAVEIWKSILEKVVEKEYDALKRRICLSLYECYHNGWGIAKDEETSKESLSLISEDPLRYRKNLEKVIEKYGTLIRFTFQKPYY